MTDVLSAGPATITSRDPGDRPVWLSLGVAEMYRLVRHPAFVASVAYVLLSSAFEGDPEPRAAYSMLTTDVTFFLGPFAFFAANLVASRSRRDGAEEWLSSLPATRRDRTAAALMATSAPAILTAVLLATAYVTFAAQGLLPHRPDPLEVLAVALSVLGAGLLGVMVARWLPWPGCAAAVMVALVAIHVALYEQWALLGAYVDWAAWSASGDSGTWVGVIEGSRGWHVVYLLALCAMAATGALLVDSRTKLPTLAAGAALMALAGVAGWAQLQ